MYDELPDFVVKTKEDLLNKINELLHNSNNLKDLSDQLPSDVSKKIYLDKLYVKLEKGKNALTFDRFLSKFSIVDHKTKKRAFITGDKKKIEIGSFLNEEEIEELITLLKKKVHDLNFS